MEIDSSGCLRFYSSAKVVSGVLDHLSTWPATGWHWIRQRWSKGRKQRPDRSGLAKGHLAGALCAVLYVLTGELSHEHRAQASDSPAGLEVMDENGRAITRQGLVLLDWEGYIANPAVKFYLVPPPGTGFPARAVLSAGESRLRFDLPSDVGPNGPRKEVTWQKQEKLPVYLSIFPDRDGEDERHR